MIVMRVIATVAALAGLAAGIGSAAWADPPTMSGTYTAQWKTFKHTLTFAPCGPGCADGTWEDGTIDRANLANGHWTMADPAAPQAFQCADGTAAPGVLHYSWDANTLAGEVWATLTGPGCGSTPGIDSGHVPFALTQVS